MCRRELCNEEDGATRLKNVADRKRRSGTGQELNGTPGWARQLRRHLKGNRNKPSSYADVTGSGGETKWDIPKVGCGNQVSKESEGVSTNWWLEPVEEVPCRVAAATTRSADGRCPPKP